MNYLIFQINLELKSAKTSQTQSQSQSSQSFIIEDDSIPGFVQATTLYMNEVRQILHVLYGKSLSTSWTNDALTDYNHEHPNSVVPRILEYKKLKFLLTKIENLPKHIRPPEYRKNSFDSDVRLRANEIVKTTKNGRISLSDGMQCVPKDVVISLPLRKSIHDLLNDLKELQKSNSNDEESNNNNNNNSSSSSSSSSDKREDDSFTTSSMSQQHMERKVGIPKPGENCMVVRLNTFTMIATLVSIDRNYNLLMPMRNRKEKKINLKKKKKKK